MNGGIQDVLDVTTDESDVDLVAGSRVDQVALSQPVKNDLVHGRAAALVAVTEPDDLFNLRRGANLSQVGALIAGHANKDAFGLSVRLSLETADKCNPFRHEVDRQLLFDLSDERLMVRLSTLAFATRNVVRVPSPGPGAEDLSIDDMNPGEFVNRLHELVGQA